MSLIDIRHRHTLNAQAARALVDDMAASLAHKYSTTHTWHEDTLTFKRPGVDGSIVLDGDEVRVRARLGMLLAPMRPTIEREIQRLLADRFTA
ncbi:MAG: polyhydroxyalkanoic acid system family protein [Salinisphaera sp.]|nr:polyhydroxyalkanoic acid system family protein [Salinisphaera sp.]